MSHNDFDKAARYTLRQLDSAGLLAWIYPVVAESWEFVGWLDTQLPAFPGEPDRRCDTIAIWQHRRGESMPVASIIESQSEPFAAMLERIAEYQLILRRTVPFSQSPLVRYDVVSTILNLTGTTRPAEWAMGREEFGAARISVQSQVLTFSERDAFVELDAIERGATTEAVLVWLPLMKGGDDVGLIRRWREYVERWTDLRRQSEYALLTRTYADLAERPIWLELLEGVGMRVSRVWEEIRQEARIEGREAGFDEAQERSCALLRSKIYRLNESRLGVCPLAVRQKIDAVKDEEALVDLLLRMPSVTHWEDLA